MARALSPAAIPIPYVAAGDSPPLLLLPWPLLVATPVSLEPEEEVPLPPEDSAAEDPDPCVLVALAVCDDPGIVEVVPKEGFVDDCYLSR